jgi:hypothetical protein
MLDACLHGSHSRIMSNDLRTSADRNLADAVARLRLADPRPAYRERLRFLKDRSAETYARALEHYEHMVLPELANGNSAMETWIQYGATLAGYTASGRLLSIDATGRAVKYAPPVQEGILVLHVPDDHAAPVLIAASPAAPTPAQQATMDLLVAGHLSLQNA